MTETEFADLLQGLKPLYEAAEAQRLNRPDRKRAPGGGSKYKHDLSERLMMTLMWLRLCLTTEALGRLFDVDKSTVSRNVRQLLPLLQELREETLEWQARRPKRGRSLEQAIHECPDLASIMDIIGPQMGSGQGSESATVAEGTQTSSDPSSSAKANRSLRKLKDAPMLRQPLAGLQQERLDLSSYRLIIAFILAIAALTMLALNTARMLRNIPYAI